MNPNAIVMTPEQFKELKEELIRELEPMVRERLREESSNIVAATPSNIWLSIKNSASGKLNHLDAFRMNQVMNGLSAIVRNTFDVKSVGMLSEVQLESAREMVDGIVKMMTERRSRTEITGKDG